MKVPSPPGSGKDTAKVKGVIVRWGLKEDGGKTLACKSCPDRLKEQVRELLIDSGCEDLIEE